MVVIVVVVCVEKR